MLDGGIAARMVVKPGVSFDDASVVDEYVPAVRDQCLDIFASVKDFGPTGIGCGLHNSHELVMIGVRIFHELDS